MWRDALLVAGKDLRVEWRSRVGLGQVVPFALVVLLLFGLALGPDAQRLRAATAGLFWVTVLLAAVLAVQRSFAIEAADGARDGLRLSGLDAGGIFVGKAAALVVQLLLLELVLAVAAALLYTTQLSGVALLIGSCLVATIGLASVGTLYGAVAAGTRVRETLLPLLFFPVVAPVLLAATKAWGAALDHRPGGGLGWLGVLAGFAAAYLAIGTVAFGPLLEDS
ncbi:MAG: ABC-type transport system involved in cytochrome c biosis, permease component [Acidimicrobiaceae bacterium]|nr:ABC-type transport system involved in cytochrome c biosis, permease component [Acidimicrobiaceae bacterium]